MKGMGLYKHGDADVLTLIDLDMPEPGPGQVRVAVRAVAMNHLDLWVRRGGPAFKHLEYPHFLGSDVVGIVDEIGEEVPKELLGQRCVIAPGISCNVCRFCLAGDDNLCASYKILGENTQGGYRQYMVVPFRNIAKFPDGLSYEEAAAANLTFLTAWQMLVEKAKVKPFDKVLVHGAASGVGVAAIQIAKLHGATVVATAGSEKKLQAARELGADHLVNYRQADFRTEIEKLLGNRSIDIVFEHVGGEVFEKSIKLLRNGGTLVTCGATAGGKPAIDLRHVFFRQLSVLGSTMGRRTTLDKIIELVEKKQLVPVVDKVFALSEAADAHRYLESRVAVGKVVLRMDESF